MDIRYYIDPDTGEPHIYNHDVSEREVEQVLNRPLEETAGRGGSVVALGLTSGARYLKVIHAPTRGAIVSS